MPILSPVLARTQWHFKFLKSNRDPNSVNCIFQTRTIEGFVSNYIKAFWSVENRFNQRPSPQKPTNC